MYKYYSSGEAARLLGVQGYRISYALTTGQVTEPIRLFGKRAYRWPDLVALAEHFHVELNRTPTEPRKDEYGRVRITD